MFVLVYGGVKGLFPYNSQNDVYNGTEVIRNERKDNDGTVGSGRGGAFPLFCRFVFSLFRFSCRLLLTSVPDLLGIFCQTVAKGYHCPTLHLWRWFFLCYGDIQGSRSYC